MKYYLIRQLAKERSLKGYNDMKLSAGFSHLELQVLNLLLCKSQDHVFGYLHVKL